jgi:hypothetical protein
MQRVLHMSIPLFLQKEADMKAIVFSLLCLLFVCCSVVAVFKSMGTVDEVRKENAALRNAALRQERGTPIDVSQLNGIYTNKGCDVDYSNYAFIKDESGNVVGVHCKDKKFPDKFEVKDGKILEIVDSIPGPKIAPPIPTQTTGK